MNLYTGNLEKLEVIAKESIEVLEYRQIADGKIHDKEIFELLYFGEKKGGCKLVSGDW